jgi:hypothetical protein
MALLQDYKEIEKSLAGDIQDREECFCALGVH